MERTIALKKLERLLGKKLAWRINPNAPDLEARAAAKAALPDARAERDTLKEQRDARQRAILEADAEYQALRAAAKAAAENVETLSGTTRHYRITVGLNLGWAFEVKAEGDSWEEVIGKLTPERVAA